MKIIDFTTYHDAIWGVFAFSGLDRITTDKPEICRFFYKWRERKVLDLLDQLHFSLREPIITSDEVYDSIMCLFMSRMIYTLTPSPDGIESYYWADNAREKIIDDCNKRFSQKELQIIKEIAQDFQNNFKLE